MQRNCSSDEEERFRVRKLEIADKNKGFIELLQQLTVCDSVSDKEFQERFQELSSYGDDHIICVIEDDRSGKIVATGSVFIEKKFIRNCSKVGHIEDVVVDSCVRGMQFGKKIIGFLTEHACSMGCYKVILDCSVENRAFYEKCGFKQKEVQMVKYFMMESIFRLLLHEQSIVQGDHSDPNLFKSIEYHRRDLATTMETAKWQLEDFEREVSLSAMTDKSQTRENVISRHKQFIGAIREQIIHVEKSLEDPSIGESVRNTEWVNLNQQDRDGLALFLSGGDTIEHIAHHNAEDTSTMGRFVYPTGSSSFNDKVIEHNTSEIENIHLNGFMHVDRNFDLKENKIRKVDSHYSTQMSFDSFEGPSSLQEVAHDRHSELESWDLEANETKVRSLFQKNKLRGYYNRMNVFGSLGNLWSTYGSRASRNFTKRWKDGEEQRHPPSYVSHSSQGLLAQTRLASGYSRFHGFCSELLARGMHLCSQPGECKARYQGSPYHIQISRHSVQLISAILFTVVVLGILAFKIA